MEKLDTCQLVIAREDEDGNTSFFCGFEREEQSKKAIECHIFDDNIFKAVRFKHNELLECKMWLDILKKDCVGSEDVWRYSIKVMTTKAIPSIVPFIIKTIYF